MTFGDIAKLLQNKTLQKKIGSTGDSYVEEYLGKIISRIPESASITVNDVIIDKAALNDLKDAKTTVEVMNALAGILETEGLAELSLADFSNKEGGVAVSVAYNGRTFSFHLVIDELANLK